MRDKMKFEESPACSCDECVARCGRRPGWFLPGEAEKAAKYLNLSMYEFFKKYLVIDYWTGEKDIEILSPGSMAEHGTLASFGFAFSAFCIFLTKDKKCMIHPVKPFECRIAHHSKGRSGSHEWVAMQWKGKDPWKMVRKLC